MIHGIFSMSINTMANGYSFTQGCALFKRKWVTISAMKQNETAAFGKFYDFLGDEN